jgi:hypothetical protein
MDVRQVLTRLRHLGLDVRSTSRTGHHKIYDPTTGAWLFDVARTPSDPNWHYNIQRNLKRIGLSLENGKTKSKKSTGQRGKRHPAVDLEALHRAQEAARVAGEREPQLEDLDTAPPSSPLWKRVKKGNADQLCVEAEQEVISNMVPRADTARVRFVKARLENFIMEKGDELRAAARKQYPRTPSGTGEIAEFVRVAMYEVAPARGIQSWKSEGAARQAIGKFHRGTGNLSVWALALVEATMDHINGMKWGVYEIPEKAEKVEPLTDEERDRIASRIQKDEAERNRRVNEAHAESQAAKLTEEELDVEAEKIAASYAEDEPVSEADAEILEEVARPGFELAVNPTHKALYAQHLLKMLESGMLSEEMLVDEILPRLDKLLLEGE